MNSEGWPSARTASAECRLAVRAAWCRQGVARRLHDTLLAAVERVLLNVHPDSKAAVAAYRAWGYRKVGDAQPCAGVPLYDVMLLDLG